MFETTIDGTAYGTYATAQSADAVRAGRRRWASTATRIEARAVESVAAELPADEGPAPCVGRDGGGVATRLVWVGARGRMSLWR